MDYVCLNNGIKMPILGFGMFRVEQKESERILREAIETGYRLIDTAAAYGNEVDVGKAVRDSGIPREEFFITTKLKCNGPDPMTREEFSRSLERLGLDYVDLYLIHQPYGNTFGAYDTMIDLMEEGRIRAIGVSNFDDVLLTDIIVNHKIRPAVNQVEISPVNQKAESVAYMKAEHVQPMAWGPLGQGSKRGMLENKALVEPAKKYGKTPAQIALRWHIQRGVVAIPKSSHKERIQENIDIFDFALTEEEMQKIAGMEAGNLNDIHSNTDFVRQICGEWDLNGFRESVKK